jgi:UDP-N-acetylglucosamine acyltransferase
MPQIHATAIVEPGARLAESATVGPYCIVGPDVQLGERVELVSHVVVAGRTTIGEGTRIYPFASIGHSPQDLKYQGEKSELVIGRNNVIREYVTMNPGTEGGGMVTRIGDNCLLMASAHVAHDCILGDHVIMVNHATLGGHVTVGDYAQLGGLSAVHQFCRIGKHAFVGGVSGVERDVIPFGMAIGDRARLSGINVVGMQRRGFTREEMQAMRSAYQRLFESEEGTFAERLGAVAADFAAIAPVREMVEFVRAESPRGLCQPKARNGG